MKSKKRCIPKDVLIHCYQRTLNGFLIFYSISDYLVFFTILCTTAKKYKIRILSVCLMVDHIHLSVIEERKGDLSNFVRDYTKTFSFYHNQTCHHTGAFFESPFGSAPKFGEKKARTNLVYVGNNAPERHLCSKAEDYRWNFLAYAVSDHPFSEELVVEKASRSLQRVRRRILSLYHKNLPLSYTFLQAASSTLNKKEIEQLIDFVVATYNVIDYASAVQFFASYKDMLTAMHANIGSEHDIKEVFVGKSDAHYARMTAILLKEEGFADIHDMLALNPEEKFRLFLLLSGKTDALPRQIASYLRMPITIRDSRVGDAGL
ncbi:MAG: transposase [Bacteroidales bacterium]|nr:transposase [Bacteroidales bacterium]